MRDALGIFARSLDRSRKECNQVLFIFPSERNGDFLFLSLAHKVCLSMLLAFQWDPQTNYLIFKTLYTLAALLVWHSFPTTTNERRLPLCQILLCFGSHVSARCGATQLKSSGEVKWKRVVLGCAFVGLWATGNQCPLLQH